MKSAAKPFGSSIVPFIYASLFIVTVWQLVVTFTNAHVALLPPPLLTAETFFELIISGELFVHTGASLGRVVAAWVLSAVVAIPLGLAMGRFMRFERVMDPLIELFRPISPLAWIPLAILWFGIGETGKIFIIFIATFFPILLNTVSGVKGVDPVLIRAGQVLGCDTDRALFTKVIFTRRHADHRRRLADFVRHRLGRDYRRRTCRRPGRPRLPDRRRHGNPAL